MSVTVSTYEERSAHDMSVVNLVETADSIQSVIWLPLSTGPGGQQVQLTSKNKPITSRLRF